MVKSTARQRRRFRAKYPERSAAYDQARQAAPDCPTCGALLRPILPWQPPYQLQGWRCFACRGKQTTRPGWGGSGVWTTGG